MTKHFSISLIKSFFRIGGFGLFLCCGLDYFGIALWLLIGAEVLGIVEDCLGLLRSYLLD